MNYNDSLGYRLYEGIKNLTNSSDRAKQIEYNFLKAFRDSKSISTNSTFNANYSDPQLQHALNIQRAKAVSKNSFDSNGNLLSTEQQIENMTKDPSRYSHVVVDPGDSLSFAGIDGEIYLTNKVRKKLIDSHGFNNDSIVSLLDNINGNTYLATDYVDNNNLETYKNIFVISDGIDYVVGLKPTPASDYDIDIVSTIHNKDVPKFLEEAVKRGNNIYTNEKSDVYLAGLAYSTGTDTRSTAYTNNISNSEGNVNKNSIV